MKQTYRLLFLMLTIVFSFGFTNRSMTCQIKKQATHSCCSKKEKETNPNPCKEDCCVQNSTITKLEETEKFENKKENKSVLIFKKTKNTPVKNSVLSTLTKGFYFKSKFLKTPGYLSVKTQSWLI